MVLGINPELPVPITETVNGENVPPVHMVCPPGGLMETPVEGVLTVVIVVAGDCA